MAITSIRKLSLFLLLCSLVLPAAIPSSQQALPDYAFVEGFVGHGQTYPLSCESRSAADLANYWGVQVGEVQFFNALPKSDNPDKGFVGSVFGSWGGIPPNPYGVHAKPVARLLRNYGLNAEAHRGLKFRDLKQEIAEGRPVIVWFVGHVWNGTPVTYTAKDGSQVIVARYEHTGILVGYDQANVYVVDAGNGNRQAHSIKNFKTSWGVLGNMAVSAVGTRPKSPTSNNNNAETYVVQPGDYLSKLARQWGISWQDLAAINDIVYPYTIYSGQVLITGVGSGNDNLPDTPTRTPKPTQKTTPIPTSKPTEPPPKTDRKTKNKDNTYKVQRGDYLTKIARELELNWKIIAQINGLTYPYVIYPGQVLLLAGRETSSPLPQKPGGNNSDNNPPNTPSYSGNTYTVQNGDDLYTLARKFGINWQTLASLNGITYPYLIYSGQVLKLP